MRLRSLAAFIALSVLSTGCLGIGSGGASQHGGYTGADARFYDSVYKQCHKGFDDANSGKPTLSTILMHPPGNKHRMQIFRAACSAAAKDTGTSCGNLYETTP
jgi:hypothetical protein